MNIAIFMDCGKQNKRIWRTVQDFVETFLGWLLGWLRSRLHNFLSGQSFFIVNFAPTCYHNKVN